MRIVFLCFHVNLEKLNQSIRSFGVSDTFNVGNAKLQKTSSNTSITNGNGNYSIAGATYGVFADKDCTKQLATLTTDENGNTDTFNVAVFPASIFKEYTVLSTLYPAGADNSLI